MGSFENNIADLTNPFSEENNADKCLIIHQSATRKSLAKKEEHTNELLNIEIVDQNGILDEQVESISGIFVELLKMKEEQI